MSRMHLSPEERLAIAVRGKQGAERDGVLNPAEADAFWGVLEQRQMDILRMWFGFNDAVGRSLTLAQIGAALGLSTTRIQQLAARSIRKGRLSVLVAAGKERRQIEEQLR